MRQKDINIFGVKKEFVFCVLLSLVDLRYMETGQKLEQIYVSELPLLSDLQLKNLLIQELNSIQLQPQDITIKRKQKKCQAILNIPQSKVEEICSNKKVVVAEQTLVFKKFFHNAHVFLGRVSNKVTTDDIRKYFENKFGPIQNYEELPVNNYEGGNSEFKNILIQFKSVEDGQKCLNSLEKIVINQCIVRVSRARAQGQSKNTDKKLFLKIISPIDNVQQLEKLINEQFRKQGKLRENIVVDGAKATITYTSSEVADRVLQNFKGNIGKYQFQLKPHLANSKQYRTIFLGGLRPDVTLQELQSVLSKFQPFCYCQFLNNHNSNVKNALAAFGSQQAYAQCISSYQQDKQIQNLYANPKNPYITFHMSQRERNEHNRYKNGKANEPKKPSNNPVIMPNVAFPNYLPTMAPQPNFTSPFPATNMPFPGTIPMAGFNPNNRMPNMPPMMPFKQQQPLGFTP